MFLTIVVKKMWRFNTNKNKAPRNWRSRARLVDLRKTTITIINDEDSPIEDHANDTITKEGFIATPVEVLDETRQIQANTAESLFDNLAKTTECGESATIATPIAVFQS